VLNNTRQSQQVVLQAPGAGTLRDVLNDNAEYPVHDEKVHVRVLPLWGTVLLVE
jgi:hypothetical protein